MSKATMIPKTNSARNGKGQFLPNPKEPPFPAITLRKIRSANGGTRWSVVTLMIENGRVVAERAGEATNMGLAAGHLLGACDQLASELFK